MTRFLATTMLAALIATPALAQSGVDHTTPQPVLQTPSATSPAPQVDSLAPNAQPSARPADDWQAAIHESGDAGQAPLPSEIGRGTPPAGFVTPRNPPYDDAGGGT
jgi:hypothetical protein